jgi:hypothetical protein
MKNTNARRLESTDGKSEISQSQVICSFTWPQFASIGQAAGATGIPESVLKKAKRAGCPGFPSSGRVLLGEFVKWSLGQDGSAGESESEKLQRAKRIKAEQHAEQEIIKTATLKEELIPKAEARRSVTRYAVALRGKLVDLPRTQALSLSLLKDPVDIETRLAQEIRGILTQMFKNDWGACVCPNCKKEIKPI